MRFMAQRIRTGEWIDRDLALGDPESVTTLSGPGQISGNLPPKANAAKWIDGLLPYEEWATMVYACDEDSGAILNHGIIVPSTSYETGARITCMGVSGYPQGYIYRGDGTGSHANGRNWGPIAPVKASRGKPASPGKGRPDPLTIFYDHWAYIQGQTASNLGVTFEGPRNTNGTDGKPRRLIGTYAEPYLLRKWEAPDLGSEIDSLAELTPFEFVEDFRWADTARRNVERRIRVGYPKVGIDKSATLRFAQGENIAEPVVVGTVDGFANYLIGLGKGDAGPSMNYAEAALSVDDGRLRRTRVLTDKTASVEYLKSRLQWYQTALQQRYDVTQIVVNEHPNAPLAQIDLGDDIRVQGEHPDFGPIDVKVRVLAKTRGVSDTSVTLTTSASAFFVYNRVNEEFA